MASDVTFRLKLIVQEALKFQTKSKRKQLRSNDIDFALRVKSIEPIYGFSCSDYIPFRHASGGGRELHFQEDTEINLDDLLSQSLPKAPLDIALKSHWLAIDGIQPSIPENPPPICKEEQLKDNIQPIAKGDHINEIKVEEMMTQEDEKPVLMSKESKKSLKEKKMELLKKSSDATKQDEQKFKPLVTHEISVEQQLYYKEITEACVGSVEQKRTEALQSLSTDPGLYQLLPRFTTFIAEGVKVNVAQHNLALLIYLLRMIKGLMDNTTLYLEKYLHELIPAVMTCIVSKQLCPRPDFENHWALRDCAARTMAQICKHFSSPTNNIQSRITTTFCASLLNDKAPLVTHYGATAGLAELGLDVVKFLILPRLKKEGELIKAALEGTDSTEKNSAEHLQSLLVKHCSVVVVKTRSLPDIQANFTNEFGFLGMAIFQKVTRLRLQLSGQAKTPSTPVGMNIAPGFAGIK